MIICAFVTNAMFKKILNHVNRREEPGIANIAFAVALPTKLMNVEIWEEFINMIVARAIFVVTPTSKSVNH